MAILSGGEFQAIGRTSDLKDSCQHCFTVMIRLTHDQIFEGDFFKTVNKEMKESFPTSVICDIRQVTKPTDKSTRVQKEKIYHFRTKVRDGGVYWQAALGEYAPESDHAWRMRTLRGRVAREMVALERVGEEVCM